MSDIETIEMHTGGEPVRIIVSGYPVVEGPDILAKRRFATENLDHLRVMLMAEPRGHRDMYGALLVDPSLPGADLAVLFLHNDGYSTMCGHAVIALGRYAVDHGIVQPTGALTRVGIECPCGLVVAWVETGEGKSSRVSFDSVPAFLFADDCRFDVAGYGGIVCDIAYGGAFYALVEANAMGLDVGGADREASTSDAFVAANRAVVAAIGRSGPALDHPDSPDLAFLYGTIFTDGGTGESVPTRNVCVFADCQIDRSPTGSGVTARMAALHAKGAVRPGETRHFESLTGAVFSGRIEQPVVFGRHAASIVRVEGKAHYTGRARFALEADDAIGRGFLLR